VKKFGSWDLLSFGLGIMMMILEFLGVAHKNDNQYQQMNWVLGMVESFG
jgi:hypothetical protein